MLRFLGCMYSVYHCINNLFQVSDCQSYQVGGWGMLPTSERKYYICLQVVEASPYLPTPENTLDKYNCDFCIHGGMCEVCGYMLAWACVCLPVCPLIRPFVCSVCGSALRYELQEYWKSNASLIVGLFALLSWPFYHSWWDGHLWSTESSWKVPRDWENSGSQYNRPCGKVTAVTINLF